MKGIGETQSSGRRAARGLACAAFALCILAATQAAAGAKSFPFVDANRNGVYDPGIDSDITAALMKGPFVTTGSVVIPAGLRATSLTGFKISAGGSITILATLQVQGEGGISLLAQEGDVILGERAALKASFVDVRAGADVVVGSGAQLQAKGGTVAGSGWVVLEAVTGNVSVDAGAQISARDDIDIVASDGGIAIGARTTLTSTLGLLNVRADGTISIVGSRLRAHDVNVSTFDEWLEVTYSTVRAARDGWVSLAAFGAPSTIDCRGTDWEGVDAMNLLLSADVVID